MPNGSDTSPVGDDALAEMRRLEQKMIADGAIIPVPRPGPIESFILNSPDEKIQTILKSFCRRYDRKYPGGDPREWLLFAAREVDEHEEAMKGYEVTVPPPPEEDTRTQEEIEAAAAEQERRDVERHLFMEAHSNDYTTDYGNADRFLNDHALNVKYIAPFSSWYIWNEKEGRWKQDQLGEIQELAKKTIMKILREAERYGFGSDRGKTLAKWAVSCQNTAHTTAILTLSCSDPWVSIPPETFDKDPMLLNMNNGMFDLSSKCLIPHAKERLISKTTGLTYDPDAKCPLWESFLERIFLSHKDRDEIIRFLQRALGYSLTGQTHEQVLFLLYGRGQNGKSVFLNTIETMMNEYAMTAASATFTTSRSDKVRNDIAAFVGKRFIKSSEITKSATMDEELIKALTGGEKFRTRFLYKEEFEFLPVLKLWLAFNHRPNIRDRTYSIWRRILLIPFEETIPVEEQDRFLQEKLHAELPGIFNWCVRGLENWQEMGLCPPVCVQVATEEYRKDTDSLFDFLNEVCDTSNPNNKEMLSEIYGAYRMWCTENHELDKNVMGSRKFAEELSERFDKGRLKTGVIFYGVALRSDIISRMKTDALGDQPFRQDRR